MAKNFRGLVLFGVLGIFFLGGIAAQEKLVGDQRPTGLIPLSSEETEAILKSWPRINKINVNWLGFERINKVKAKKGKALLGPSSIRPIGQEVDSSIAEPGASVQSIVTNSELAGDLPAYVDNSKLKYFPPVRSQGTLSSCLPFAVVYYQLSYMAAFQRNLDIRDGNDNSNKYSPKWVYNMINGGFDNGTAQGDIYSILQNHGACTWDEFPYDNDYLSWCLNTNAWRNALFVKTNPAQYLSPVSSEQYLALVKGLLTNGYILEIGTCILSWQSKTVLDDPSTTDDDSEVGKNVAFWVNGTQGAHAMVIVGYNDAIWTDINGNGIIDAGEKGAFRLANPWGDWWQDGGFGWMAYDALRSVSAVADGPSEGRTEAFLSDMAFVLTVTDNYSPLVTAEFTVNHAKRNQLRLSLGRSDISATAPTTEWFPAVFQNQGGAYAFNGTNTPIDGTFVLDFSDLLVDGSGSLRYYIGMNDNTSGDSATLSAFKIIDRTFEPDKEVVSSLVPQYADGDQQAYAYVDYAYSGYVYNHAPIVSYAQASPLSGTTLDTYTYYVKYYDQDGDVPLIKNVYIDGNPHTMIFESGNSASDGWYQFQTALSPGSHNFYFYFEDNHADSGRDPFMGTLSGPVVVLPHLVTLSNVPSGELHPLLDLLYTYSTGGSTCDLGHDVQYRFDWGDGAISDWLDVGVTSASHAWSSTGPYSLKAQARCANDTAIESSWSDALAISVPYIIPFAEAFSASTLPPNWTQQNPDGVGDMWYVWGGTQAGGQPSEVRCGYRNVNPGTTRLITPPIDTTGYSTLRLRFNHFFDIFYSGGIQLSVQTSSDGENWTDEPWTVTTSDFDIGPATVDTVLKHNLNIETTYIAFVITGNLNNFNDWFIDNIEITAPGKLRLFVKSTADTSIWLNTMLGDETYEGWQIMTPGGTTTTPALGVFNNALHLIVKDSGDDKMWYRSMDSTGAWGDWAQLYGLSPSTASMTVFNNKLYLVVRGSDDRIYYRPMDTSGVWGGWSVLSVGATTTTPVVAAFNGKLHLVVKSSVDTSIWWTTMDTTGAWADWQQLYGLTPDPVAMVEYNNRLYMFVRGTDDNIYYRYLNTEGTWGSWTAMYGKTTVSPTVAAFNGKLYLIVKSSVDSTIYMRSMDTEETWGNWSIMPGLTTIPVAVAIY